MDQFFDQVDIYIRPTENDPQEQVRKCSFSLQKSNENLQTNNTKMNSEANKNNTKGKYVEKLKNYTPKQQFCHLNQQDEGGSLLSLSKRERNRISAKQSRDRKKLYIQLMEYEHKKLQNELRQINKQIQSTKQKINVFCSENKTIYGFSKRSQLQGKLQRILANPNTNGLEEQISIILDSIIFRMGATGRERLQKQIQCYKQIINLSLPPTHRYLIWAVTQSKHIFNQNLGSKGWQAQNDQFNPPLNLDQIPSLIQAKELLQITKTQIYNKKQSLIQLVTKFEQHKGMLEEQIRKLDAPIDGLRDILNPIQGAKLLLFTNRNKFRNCMNFFKQDIEISYIQQISAPKKKVKKQQQ